MLPSAGALAGEQKGGKGAGEERGGKGAGEGRGGKGAGEEEVLRQRRHYDTFDVEMREMQARCREIWLRYGEIPGRCARCRRLM